MKVARILAVPVALVADAVTLGNFGDRSFTQQVFDAERRDQNTKQVNKLIKSIVKAARK